jgi:hypothetical protein
MDAGRSTLFPVEMDTDPRRGGGARRKAIEKKERDGYSLHYVPVHFGSYRSVKMYFVKDVSVKDNSTHLETIYTVG